MRTILLNKCVDIECFHEEMIKKIVEESIDSLNIRR
nr:MAG TPA: hypothetical protein [Caudoviricetes sp.]